MLQEKMVELWHSEPTTELLRNLQVDSEKGLTDQEAQRRLDQWGKNVLPEASTRSYLGIFFHQFLNPLIYLLLIAAGIAFFINEPKDAIVILVVVILNAVIGTLQEGRAEQSLRALRKLSTLKARVIRSGGERVVEASDLVPGDILILAAGDAVPADARLLHGVSLAAAEAALTGESVPSLKNSESLPVDTALADRSNMVYAGTHLTSGRGQAVVVTTGLRSEIGKIAAMTMVAEDPKTQLELRVQEFGRYLLFASLIVFVLVIAIGLLRGSALTDIFMIAVSQMVSLVPEGLPVAMTIALAVGVQRMASRGTIVRRLSAVETLGSTTVICSDKTGTLTRNEMTVTTIYSAHSDSFIEVTGSGYSPIGDLKREGDMVKDSLDPQLEKLIEIGALCNDSQLLSPDSENTQWRILGDPTEGALVTLAVKAGLDVSRLRNQFPRKAEIPFSSDVKMMATQHFIDGYDQVFIKGAPESVLEYCGLILDGDRVVSLAPEKRAQIQKRAGQMASSALRVLALGYVEKASVEGRQQFAPFMGKVIFVGLLGQIDPPREEVAASVLECKAAGVRPVMVTGDHKATGLAIAQSLGINRPGDLAIDGRELDLMSDAELTESLDKVSVFARVHPEQKLRIVEAYQKKGEVVAMTGDGVNDAPALVRANVGVAMGITGTEVAKEASKIVITDDNFSTIVTAISEGRLVYQNIKKLLLFLFVTSIDEVIVLFLALLMGYPPPLAAVQILWINLVTEGTLTVNLIMEPHEGGEMTRPPVSTKEPLLDRALLMRLPLLVSVSVAATFGWFLYRTAGGASVAQVQTETFTILAVCQWFNVLNCRSATRSSLNLDLLKNRWLLAGLLLGNVLHLAVIYWPPLGRFFHTVPIDGIHFIAIGLVASNVLWAEEIRKWWVRRTLKKENTVLNASSVRA